MCPMIQINDVNNGLEETSFCVVVLHSLGRKKALEGYWSKRQSCVMRSLVSIWMIRRNPDWTSI